MAGHGAVLDAILQAAHEKHVPDQLAVATALVEDPSLDPAAVGDGGTSFGIFQLHRGGELGNLSPAQAEDPLTNARVALGVLGRTIAQHPEVRDPGTLAAMAQRPADRRGYALKVDGHLNTGDAAKVISSHGSWLPIGDAASASSPTPGGGAQDVGLWSSIGGGLTWTWDKTGGWVLHSGAQAAESAGGVVAAPFVAIYNLFRGIWDFFTSASTWVRIGLALGGAMLVFFGLKAALGGSGQTLVPVPV